MSYVFLFVNCYVDARFVRVLPPDYSSQDLPHTHVLYCCKVNVEIAADASSIFKAFLPSCFPELNRLVLIVCFQDV